MGKWEDVWIEELKSDSSAINYKIDKQGLKKLSKEDLITVIAELVSQHCCDLSGDCDTAALSADAKAFAVLSAVGLMKVEAVCHRYAHGKLVDIWEDIIKNKEYMKETLNKVMKMVEEVKKGGDER